MEASILRTLQDKAYDKRKQSALEVEKVVREAAAANDVKKLHQIIAQLCELATSQQSNAKSGGIMGLAGTSIALGPKIAEYLGAIVPPVLACFTDPDNKVRYFACESMYNVAKVAMGEILVFFNELFDAMSKLAADTELPVKNGAELLDRLIKDIVIEQAAHYTSNLADPLPMPRASTSSSRLDEGDDEKSIVQQPRRAFSLPSFIPLLQERIYVLNPFTRTYLISWLTVLNSVPELELVSFLPDFLDGLLKFLGDPTVEIRTATQNLLADFLAEIKDIAEVEKLRKEELVRRAQLAMEKRQQAAPTMDLDVDQKSDVQSMEVSRTAFIRRLSEYSEVAAIQSQGKVAKEDDVTSVQGAPVEDQAPEELAEGEEDEGSVIEDLEEDSGEWTVGQDVFVDHAAIVEILLTHLTFPDEEVQSTCLRWIAELLLFAQPVMVPFAPRLIPVILSSLAHHVNSIRSAANQTNENLFQVIHELPTPPPPQPSAPGKQPQQPQDKTPASPRGDRSQAAQRNPNSISPNGGAPAGLSQPTSRLPSMDRSGGQLKGDAPSLASQFETLGLNTTRHSGKTSDRNSSISDMPLPPAVPLESEQEVDPIDYEGLCNALTLQFLNENEETRIAALEWLMMLHQKAPRKILAIDDGTFPALLKTLSDPSEEVVQCDLQLLAQISSSSEDEYFPSFMLNLLSLFSTDRHLLETRGSLIIRQLCVSLNTERIYRTFAEILEKDDDLEFASIMVQNLNLIMITSPELSDFRRRLKTLESKDGQTLFTILYRSWSHNAVATFTLCLLAQAYEQACALLQIFAELEITVSLLIQIDKLVQLLESPVFTSLRLQLLEPDRHPFLLKAMYGLLMLLPQSSAFATLRNRLSAVNSPGLLQAIPKASTNTVASTRSTLRRDPDIRWAELLTHFRQIQMKHERARRSQPALDAEIMSSPVLPARSQGSAAAASLNNAARRRSGAMGPPPNPTKPGTTSSRPPPPCGQGPKRRLASTPINTTGARRV